MGSRLADHLAGLALPIDPDRLGSLEPRGSDPTSSSYTEANPRPGATVPQDARAKCEPVIQGGQGQGIELVVLKGGSPTHALSDDLEIGYRFAHETDAQTRGWCHPGILLGWGAPKWTDSQDYSAIDICVIPTNQKLVLTYCDPPGDRGIAVFDPATYTWTDVGGVFGFTTGAAGTGGAEDCIVALPDGRILCFGFGHVYRSDDDGSTWTLHSRYVLHSLPTTMDRGRMAYNDGAIAIVFCDSNVVPGRVMQYASDDMLGSVQQVYDSDATAVGTSVSVQALPVGGFVVGFVRDADSYAVCRIISSAWQSLDDATDIVIREAASQDMTIVVDPDGLMWCFATDATNPHLVYLYVSVDAGRTWDVCTEGALRVAGSAGAGDYLDNFAACPFEGGIALAHNWTASTGNEDGSVGVAFLGGWSTVTNRSVEDDSALDERAGFGPSSTYTHRSWIPIELPGDSGLYTANGAGTQVLEAPAGLTVTTSANTRYYTASLGTHPSQALLYTMVMVSGGSLTTDDVVFSVRVSNAVSSDHHLTIRHSTLGFRIIDDHADTTLATELLDLTVAIQVAIAMQANPRVWWRRLGETEWTQVLDGSITLTDAGSAAANGQTLWGHFASSTSESRWNMVCETERGNFGAGLEGNDPALGRPHGALPVPLPSECGDGTTAAHLAVRGGAGALGEVYEARVDHDYPIEHLIPKGSPSPSERWRTTSKAEQLLVWDFDTETWIGDSLALVALGCNFASAALQYYDGAAWQTAGTLNLGTGFGSLSWNLTGDTLTPAAVGSAGGRFVAEGELAGGMAIITASSATVARRIKWNSAGFWGPTGSSTTVRPRILLEDVDGTEDTSGAANGTLVWPSGVLVVHLSSIQRRRYWRVQLGSGMVTPAGEDYYEAGILVPYAIRAFGGAPDWGWSQERAPNVEVRTSRYGTTRARRLGPTRRTWSMGWPGGVNLRDLRQETAPDYLGSSVGLPLTATEDVPWLVGGLLELADSGAVPVVALAEIPDVSGTTITDPTMWLYGRLIASVRQDHLVGTEGDNEIVRVPDIVVEEIV